MGREKQADSRKSDSQRRLKVNVIYGDVPLVECMKHIIRGKHNLR